MSSITNSYKRLAVILNQYKFKNATPRDGTEADKRNLIEVLPKLGFGYEIYDDSKADEIMKIPEILQSNKTINWDNMDSILIIILSHGLETTITAYDKPFELSKFIDKFNPNVFPEMQGKTKLFLISTCRGEASTISVNTADSRTSYDSPNTAASRTITTKINGTYNNLVIIYSTLKNQVSIRDSTYGTYLIQEFSLAIQNFIRDENKNQLEITELHRIISRNMIKRDSGEKQLPEIVSTLDKPYFFKKTNNLI